MIAELSGRMKFMDRLVIVAEARTGELDLFDRMQKIANAKTEDLGALLKVAGLDPRKNLRFQDWTGSSFQSNDLRDFDFTGARLLGCDFTDALIIGARFDKAEIARVGFESASQTNLRRARDWNKFAAAWRLPQKGAVTDRHLRQGMVFQDAPFAPELVVIPPGRFMMGSPEDESGRDDNEGPQHEVTIPHALAVGRYAVTFEEWDFAQDDKDWTPVTGMQPRKPDDERWGRGRRPAIDVSWDDAKAYVKWLAHRTGQAYRLLSEAEWEYACRAETATPFWWGASIKLDRANYDGNFIYAGGGSRGESRHRTVAIDSFEPNPWGLYQVHGNVWEWCEDCWRDSYKRKPENSKLSGAAWTGIGRRRVLRGGSCLSDPASLRAAKRFWNYTYVRHSTVGFRVSRTLNPC
jgi:formylglycine-generating enzyme required for sulfatase activity